MDNLLDDSYFGELSVVQTEFRYRFPTIRWVVRYEDKFKAEFAEKMDAMEYADKLDAEMSNDLESME